MKVDESHVVYPRLILLKNSALGERLGGTSALVH